MSDIEDALDGTPSTPRKRGPKPSTVKKAATKPSKAVTVKPGPTPKGAKANGTAPATKATRGRPPAAPSAAKTATAAKPGRPKSIPADVEMSQPEDSVVLKAVRKLKVPTMASKFSAELGVHRRVIRAQLQRLSKDKANGVGMKKEGANWIVSNTQK